MPRRREYTIETLPWNVDLILNVEKIKKSPNNGETRCIEAIHQLEDSKEGCQKCQNGS